MEWLHDNMDAILTMMAPNVSDHAFLHIKGKENVSNHKNHFKFKNCIVKMNSFHEVVKNNWLHDQNGNPMYVLWQKLKRLKLIIKVLIKPLKGIKSKVEHVKTE